MRLNIELRLPRSRKSFYYTLIITCLVGIVLTILAFPYIGYTALLGLSGFYYSYKIAAKRYEVLINDDGISIETYYFNTCKNKEFYKWKQIIGIGLFGSDRAYNSGSLKIYFRDGKNRIDIGLERITDIRDQWHIGHSRKPRIRDFFKKMCPAHGASFGID